MTDEELDMARANEAMRRDGADPDMTLCVITAARLAREGWMPVDDDLIEARECAAMANPLAADGYRKGIYDTSGTIQAILIAIKRAKERSQ